MGSGLKESSPHPLVAPGPPPGQGSHVSVGLAKLVSLRNLGGPCSDTFLQASVFLPKKPGHLWQPFELQHLRIRVSGALALWNSLNKCRMLDLKLQSLSQGSPGNWKLREGEPLVWGSLRLHTHSSHPLGSAWLQAVSRCSLLGTSSRCGLLTQGSPEGPSSCSPPLTT